MDICRKITQLTLVIHRHIFTQFFSTKICNFSSILTIKSSFFLLEDVSQIYRKICYVLFRNEKTLVNSVAFFIFNKKKIGINYKRLKLSLFPDEFNLSRNKINSGREGIEITSSLLHPILRTLESIVHSREFKKTRGKKKNYCKNESENDHTLSLNFLEFLVNAL